MRHPVGRGHVKAPAWLVLRQLSAGATPTSVHPIPALKLHVRQCNAVDVCHRGCWQKNKFQKGCLQTLAHTEVMGRAYVVEKAKQARNAGGRRQSWLHSLVCFHWNQVFQRGGLACNGVFSSFLQKGSSYKVCSV